MAERLNKKKRPREEDEQNLMSGPNAVISSSELLTNLHNENQLQEQQQDSSVPITCVHPLRLRELGKNRKLPNIYKDYHVQAFVSDEFTGSISFMVAGDDIVLVVYSDCIIVPFRRDGDRISAVEGDNISCRVDGHITSVCYNNHNNSFLIAYWKELGRDWRTTEIVSLEIASIRAGRIPKLTQVFPGESCIKNWCFDIPTCRGMIHNPQDRKFKFCELKEYRLLFTLPDLGGTRVDALFETLSPGNMDMVMYDTRSENGSVEVQVRIYSKLNGILQKEIFVHQPGVDLEIIEFVMLCGSDTLIMQIFSFHMEVVEIISCENPVSIKRRNTEIMAVCNPYPYYLHKRSQFICYTEESVHLCNLQGEILVTLEDHQLALPKMRYVSDSYIFDSEDIIISLCHRFVPSEKRWMYSVNVSSIVTGECLAKFNLEYPIYNYIRDAAFVNIPAIGYDERTHQIFTGSNDGIFGVWSNKFHHDDWYLV